MQQQQPTTSGGGGTDASYSGNGSLRGGGVKRIYANKPSLQDYAHKLDYRLSLSIALSLLTLASVLFVYGLFHEQVQASIYQYIRGVRETIEEEGGRRIALMDAGGGGGELPPSVGMEELEGGGGRRRRRQANETVEGVADNNGTMEEEVVATTPEAVTMESPPPPPIEPPPPADDSTLTYEEILDYESRFASVSRTIWTLFTVDVMALMVVAPLAYSFHARKRLRKSGCWPIRDEKLFRTIYRVIIVLVCMLLLGQLFYLFAPLLFTSWTFPWVMDRIFAEGSKPRPDELIELLEKKYSCNFDAQEVLIQYRLQEPCLPKLKNYLLPVYAVFILIIADLTPLFFAAFTYGWDAFLKEYPPVKRVRRRVERNANQRRVGAVGSNNNNVAVWDTSDMGGGVRISITDESDSTSPPSSSQAAMKEKEKY